MYRWILGWLTGELIYCLYLSQCKQNPDNQKLRWLSELFWMITLLVLDNWLEFPSAHFYFAYAILGWLSVLSLMDFTYYAFFSRWFYGPAIIFGIWKYQVIQLSIWESLFSAGVVYIILESVSNGYQLIKNESGMGRGDLELFVYLTYLLGFDKGCKIILYSCLLGLPFSFRGKIPLVPMITMAFLIVFCNIV